MKHQIPLLIAASLLGLLALSAIQGYLISNTFKLKKNAYLEQVTAQYAATEDHSEAMDSINKLWYVQLKRLMMAHHAGTIKVDSLTTQLRKNVQDLDNAYEAAYRDTTSGLRFQKRLVSLILLDNIQNDTILSSMADSSILLLGANFTHGLTRRLGRTTSQTSVSMDNDQSSGEKQETIRYQMVTDNLVSIEGWHQAVLHEMSGLLVVAFLFLLFVFGLLYYSISTLIKQKKIAAIKTDFVNNITHEFKTPLATLAIATKILRTSELSQREEEVVASVERQNARLQKLTDQVLNQALSYQDIRLKKELVNITPYLHDLLNDFMLSQDVEQVRLQRQITTENQAVALDKFHLTSALLNLLDNAVKYNPPPVSIKVSARVKNGLEICVTDDGLGISATHQPHLFEKFYRIGNQEEHNVKGLGLGLYFTRQVVRAHGGNIRLKSKEGEGSSFTIQLALNQQ